ISSARNHFYLRSIYDAIDPVSIQVSIIGKRIEWFGSFERAENENLIAVVKLRPTVIVRDEHFSVNREFLLRVRLQVARFDRVLGRERTPVRFIHNESMEDDGVTRRIKIDRLRRPDVRRPRDRPQSRS